MKLAQDGLAVKVPAPLIPWFGEALSADDSAAAGAVLGALIGDAAGGVLEFIGRKPATQEAQRALLRMPGGGVFRLAPGQFTDDGELTVALLGALAREDGRWNIDRVAYAYSTWAASQPFDMGGTTVAALGRRKPAFLDGLSLEVAARAEKASMSSKANGALMRISPLAVAGRTWPEQDLVEAARSDSRLTHPNPACQHANAAYVLALRHLIAHPGEVRGAVEAAKRYLEAMDDATEVRAWLNDALEGSLAPVHPLAGFVRHGFTRAFHHLARQTQFDEAIVSVLSEGGDTDTNACIVGAMLGALQGVHRLPIESLGSLVNCETAQGQLRPDAFTIKAVREHLPVLLRCSSTNRPDGAAEQAS